MTTRYGGLPADLTAGQVDARAARLYYDEFGEHALPWHQLDDDIRIRYRARILDRIGGRIDDQ
jgi:hypothetical protein